MSTLMKQFKYCQLQFGKNAAKLLHPDRFLGERKMQRGLSQAEFAKVPSVGTDMSAALRRVEETMYTMKRAANFTAKVAALQEQFAKELDATCVHYGVRLQSDSNLSREYRETNAFKSITLMIRQTRAIASAMERSAKSIAGSDCTTLLQGSLSEGQRSLPRLRAKVAHALTQCSQLTAAAVSEKRRLEAQKSSQKLLKAVEQCRAAIEKEKRVVCSDAVETGGTTPAVAAFANARLRSLLMRRSNSSNSSGNTSVRSTRQETARTVHQCEQIRLRARNVALANDRAIDEANGAIAHLHLTALPNLITEIKQAEDTRMRNFAKSLRTFRDNLRAAAEAVSSSAEQLNTPTHDDFFDDMAKFGIREVEPDAAGLRVVQGIPPVATVNALSVAEIDAFGLEFASASDNILAALAFESAVQPGQQMNKRLQRHFGEFLETRAARENLDFVLDVAEFKTLDESDGTALRRAATRIFRRYVAPKAARRVNLSSAVLDAIAEVIEQTRAGHARRAQELAKGTVTCALDAQGVTSALFDEAHREILRLLQSDQWMSFLRSSQFDALASEIALSDAEKEACRRHKSGRSAPVSRSNSYLSMH
ncbi:MAG: hypothetical protein MHM6MM_001387 [Cercozoa sp. M6MM]